jgi:hypothetical protein
MATNELKVSLPCDCGGTVVAGAKDAGGTITCGCGRAVAVPKLSQLRTLAGADAFITNPVEAIRKQQAQGISPAGETCVLCGSLSPVIYKCHAICEWSYAKRTSSDDTGNLIKLLVLPRLWLLASLLSGKEPDESDRRGHDVSISFDLPVCDPCAATAGKITRPSVAKRLMIRVPLYKELLKHYPKLELKVERP